MNYFYDGQTRRWVEQFIREMSDYFVEYGIDPNGNTILQRVPVTYAQTNKQASTILFNNSENKMPTVPAIVVYIEEYQYSRQRMTDPSFVDKMHLRERQISGGKPTTNPGSAFTVERLMPMPFDITFNVDIWTSSIDQKLQLWEQMLTKFNPSHEVQSTDNYIDWTSLSAIFLQETRWSSKSASGGGGNSNDIDIMTFKFMCPVWITAPAKVKRRGIITDIVASIYDAQGDLVEAILDQQVLMGNRQYFSPLGYNLIATNTTLTLAPSRGPVINNTNLGMPSSPINIAWQPLIDRMGSIKDGISQAVLIDSVTEKMIIGDITINPYNPEQLLFNPETSTLDLNSIPSITSIVDPTQAGPGTGLLPAAAGQRYLLTNSVGNAGCDPVNAPKAWQSQVPLIANANDIIEYDGLSWNIVFDSHLVNTVIFVMNNFNNIQYRWTGTYWKKNWNGTYAEGFWGLILS